MRLLVLTAFIGSFHLLLAQGLTVTRDKLGAEASELLHIIDSTGGHDLPPNIESVRLRAGQYAAARLSETPAEATSKTEDGNVRMQLPVRIVGTNAQGETLTLRPVVEVSGGGLRLLSGSGFSGQIHIGLEDEERPTQTRPLGRSIQMLVTGAADSITPSTVSLDHTNLPFQTVDIAARSPSNDVQVHIRSDFDPAGIELSVPVVRPVLSVRASPRTIQGFGLETAELVVAARGAPGDRLPSVTLSSEKSRPEPPVVAIDPATGSGTATVRSSGVGAATVTAEAEGLQSTTETITFVFPWAFAIAALVGGLVGGLYQFIRKKSDEAKRINASGLAWHLVLGACAGFLGSVAYSVGLNLLPVGLHPAATVGEALVFVTAGLCAAGSGTLVGKLPGSSTAEG